MQLHMCALRHVRSLRTDDVANIVARSIVASKLDYCNSLLYDTPAATFDVLQREQSRLARVVMDVPALRSLHWLPE